MKLELKHLAAYLPYKLTGIIPHISNSDVYEVIGFDSDSEDTYIISKHSYKTQTDFIQYFKPILRPMSDIKTKRLDFGCYTNTMHGELLDNWDLGSNDNRLVNIEDTIKNNLLLCDLPYQMICELFARHFDVFGLIPLGLAIDINSLK